MFWTNLKMLIGFMPSVRFAECTQCHVCSSPKLRVCPNCKASFPQNYIIRKWTASDIPDDRVEVFVTCHACSRSLKPATQKCPECGATIRRDYARESIAENVSVGQAYVNAQKIESTNSIAIITLVLTLGITAYAYLLDLPHAAWFLLIPFTMSAGVLLVIRQWFRWFGSYKSDHADFVVAQHKVRQSLRRSLAALAAELTIAILLLEWLIFHR